VWKVTGASGFVGGHVLEALRRSGLEAKAIDRKDLPAWDVASLSRALEGVEGVVHAASVVHKPTTPAEEYTRFNVEGTRALLEAARAKGVRRFVFISSIKVNGETPEGTIDELTPVAAEAHYARTKAEAEGLVLAATDLAPVVLRLCPVYGRGDKGNVRTMIRAIWRRRFFVPGDGATRKSIVHVSTVADVVRAATQKPATGIFVVADRHAPSIRELADAIADALGRRRPVSIPRPLLRGVASLVGRAARAVGVTTPISGTLIDKAMTSSVCDPSRVERELGVECRVDLAASLADEIAWLRDVRAI
jgi:nucleoside-diphosphate-sugar epimerase